MASFTSTSGSSFHAGFPVIVVVFSLPGELVPRSVLLIHLLDRHGLPSVFIKLDKSRCWLSDESIFCRRGGHARVAELGRRDSISVVPICLSTNTFFKHISLVSDHRLRNFIWRDRLQLGVLSLVCESWWNHWSQSIVSFMLPVLIMLPLLFSEFFSYILGLQVGFFISYPVFLELSSQTIQFGLLKLLFLLLPICVNPCDFLPCRSVQSDLTLQPLRSAIASHWNLGLNWSW